MIDPVIDILMNMPIGSLKSFSDEMALPIPEWIREALGELDPESSLNTVPRDALISSGLKAWRKKRSRETEFALSGGKEDRSNYLLVCQECGHLQEVTL